MSTSLLYHGFGLTDQEYLKTEHKGSSVIFHIQTKEDKLRCSYCQSFHVIKKVLLSEPFARFRLG
jgi:hypothetical protein